MQSGRDLRGECHCGSIRARIHLSCGAADIELRACQCAFCSRRGARTFADSRGRAVIEAVKPALLRRYRFGLQTADYLICVGCGVYVGALVETEGARLVTLNAVGLDLDAFRGRIAKPVDYGEESFEERLRRRLAAWMPAELSLDARAASTDEQAIH